MLFAGKIIIVIVCLCATFEHNQAQDSEGVFYCNFDDGSDCGFINSYGKKTLKIDQGMEWNYTTDGTPSRPLSDATSVYSLTVDNQTCDFSNSFYENRGSFCEKKDGESDYKCKTKQGESKCQNGSYAYVSMNMNDTQSFESPNITDLTDSPSRCLILYYYFLPDLTNASIKISWQDASKRGESSDIITLNDTTEVQWNPSQTPFNVSATNYTIQITFMTIGSYDGYQMAIDNLKIIVGDCPNEPMPTTTPSPTTRTTEKAMSTTAINANSTQTTSTTISTTTSTTAMNEDSTQTTSSTTSIITSITEASNMSVSEQTTTPKPNFASAHGLSFAIGILAMLMYFIMMI